MSLRFPWAWGPSNSLDWTLGVTDRVPVALTIETAGGTSTLDLTSLLLTELDLKTSASTMAITFPAQAGLTIARNEASAASLVIRVPLGVAARIRAVKAIGSADIDSGRFLEIDSGREYRSADYESSEYRVDLSIDVSLGSVEIL